MSRTADLRTPEVNQVSTLALPLVQVGALARLGTRLVQPNAWSRSKMRNRGFVLCFPRPKTFALVMRVCTSFQRAIKLRMRIIRRRIPDRLALEGKHNLRSRPVYFLDPLRRDKRLMSKPPVAGIYDQIADCPSPLIDQNCLNVSNISVDRLDVIPQYGIAAAKMRILHRVLLIGPRTGS